MKLGLTWLSDRSESHRLAGTLVLHELAVAAPAVFNVHVKVFVEVIWNGIRDPKLHIREAAVGALRACLILIEKRETRYRVQWYYRLFEQTRSGLGRAMPVEVVHGSLLALGELIRHTGEFMLARYREVCDTVLRFRDSKEKLVRRAIITLLPRLAAFAPERFTKSYLDSATEHLLGVLASPADRGSGARAGPWDGTPGSWLSAGLCFMSGLTDGAMVEARRVVGGWFLEPASNTALPALAAGFMAIAEMSMSLSKAGVAGKLRRGDYLRPIALHIRDALLGRVKSRTPCSEALHCAGTLSVALGKDWQPYIPLLLEPMFQTGLSGGCVRVSTAVRRTGARVGAGTCLGAPTRAPWRACAPKGPRPNPPPHARPPARRAAGARPASGDQRVAGPGAAGAGAAAGPAVPRPRAPSLLQMLASRDGPGAAGLAEHG